jgi:hypothetical protein
MDNIDDEYGLFPDTWGPHAWEFLHSVSFAYPKNPTTRDKKGYMKFFDSLKYVLPCTGCRKSYGNFIVDKNELLLNDDVFENRDKLTKWVYDLHERVNKKLGKTYKITYDEVYEKYNNYRVKDNMDLVDRAKCFKAECKKEVPYFDIDIAKKFIEYAKKRGVYDFEKKIKINNNLQKDSDEWENRTKKCRETIQEMRLNAKESIENSGNYKNLPTIDELKLMQNLCTTIPLNKIEKMIKILDGDTSDDENLADGEGRCTECAKPRDIEFDSPTQSVLTTSNEQSVQNGGEKIIHKKYKFVINHKL